MQPPPHEPSPPPPPRHAVVFSAPNATAAATSTSAACPAAWVGDGICQLGCVVKPHGDRGDCRAGSAACGAQVGLGLLAQVRQARAPLCRGGRSAAWLHDVPDQGCRCTSCRTKLTVLENVWLGWDEAGGAEPRKKRAQVIVTQPLAPTFALTLALTLVFTLALNLVITLARALGRPRARDRALTPSPSPNSGGARAVSKRTPVVQRRRGCTRPPCTVHHVMHGMMHGVMHGAMHGVMHHIMHDAMHGAPCGVMHRVV